MQLLSNGGWNPFVLDDFGDSTERWQVPRVVARMN